MLMLQSQPAEIVSAGAFPAVRSPRAGEAVELDHFDSTNMRCWLTRGRSVEQATELARIWRSYPDLPPTAPLVDRMARGRERIAAMKPLNDAIAAKTEAERQNRNFAFMASRAQVGTITDSEIAILRGRDLHGYDWDLVVAYASGWTAADAGWEHRFCADGSRRQDAKREAYDRGFADGGGDQADLFDAARRSNLAAIRRDNQRPVASLPPRARPAPSSWPKPSDHARPTRWSRRLLIVSDATIEEVTPGLMRVSSLRLVDEIRARPGTEAMTIVTIDRNDGFVVNGCPVETKVPIAASRADEMIADPSHGDALHAILSGHEIDDVLIAVQGDYLRIVDAFASALPLCANMERSQNSLLKQRAHLRCWLDRGYDGTDNLGAGHIRWGKAIRGLTGKLGEFTARHVGPAPRRGYLIRIEAEGGTLAEGYATSTGERLATEITVSNKTNIRREMAAALRAFGGATRLMDACG
ncbi:hypothetical protein [Sphingomonas faeni]|uniref:hypothetical protein n=1 Tax=Sphingomonas faeni TaxID=185950 RepID=UPI0024131278|nr:hypothetical protein [Sphingomonas faeni]